MRLRWGVEQNRLDDPCFSCRQCEGHQGVCVSLYLLSRRILASRAIAVAGRFPAFNHVPSPTTYKMSRCVCNHFIYPVKYRPGISKR